MALVLAGLTFLIIVLVVAGVMIASTSGTAPDKVVAKRLDAIERSAKRGSESLELKVVRDELLSDVPAIHRLLLKWKFADKLRNYIGQAGMKVKPGRLILLSAILAFACYLIVGRLAENPLIGLAAVPVGALLPIGVVAFQRMRRLKALKGVPRSHRSTGTCGARRPLFLDRARNDHDRASGTGGRRIPHHFRRAEFWSSVTRRPAEPFGENTAD